MELLHHWGLTNPETSVEPLKRLQENRNERAAQMTCHHLKSENTAEKTPKIYPVSNEKIESVGDDLNQSKNGRPRLGSGSVLAELTLYKDTIDVICPAKELINIFNQNPLLPGIIITNQGKFAGLISRRRFFEQMSRPFSLELFYKRPIKVFYGLLKKDILILQINTPIVAAARQSLLRSPDLIYEPIIVQDRQENYQLLDVHQLLLAQSHIHDSVTEELRLTEARYRSIFENAVDGIFQATPDGRYLDANPALATLYGYATPQELIESVTDIAGQIYVDPHRRSEFIAILKQQDRVSKFESQIYRKDGSIIWISENARAVKDSHGNLLYYEGTAEDINDRKQAESALRQSEALFKNQATELEQTLQVLQNTQTKLVQSEKMSSLGQLIAGVAHEINNPVSSISNNLPHANQYMQNLLKLLHLYTKYHPQPHPEIEAEIAEIDLEFLKEDLPKLFYAMQQGAERIREIALSLRNFSRLDEKQMTPFNIHQAIDSTLMILHHRLKPKGEFPEIQVIKEYGKLPLVECYVGQLNQVFMNLIGNAIDALEMKQGEWKIEQKNGNCQIPTILIRTEVVDDWVKITIADNGLGMTLEVCQHLFEPFFTTKPPGKGTGLGLSISSQIVEERHHGKLKCVSAPGEGAKFTIELPIRQKHGKQHNRILT
ncbi:MAG TPA: ATP-binding protein [Leptolyngbyaceae cyanobacterium]